MSDIRNSCSAPGSAAPPPRHVEVAVGVLVRQTQAGPQVLIARRPHDTVLPGLWELPGGKVEPNETVEQCVVREFREELGIEVHVGRALPVIEHTYDHARVRLHPFFCGHASGEPRNLAVTEHRWVHPGELDGYAFPAANGSLLRAVRRELSGEG